MPSVDPTPVIGQRNIPGHPRYAGPATFALLPRLDQVERADLVVLGIPFDAGTSFRPGARFGPGHIRENSRQLHPYHQMLKVRPFDVQQVADAGDLGVTPFNIGQAVATIEAAADELSADGARILALGGDHTVALPLLRSVVKRHGPVGVLHFDAHLDTWDTHLGAEVWHGSPFRRASEEGLLDPARCLHVGIRGGVYGPEELVDDRDLGFRLIRSEEYQTSTVLDIAERIHDRLAGGPVYVSVDIDVLDPAHAPGTGTPEVGGMTTRELLHGLRSLAGLDVVGADVVEVAPAYDHAGLTGLAAAQVAYELIAVMGRNLVDQA